jgi:hypothetical protein
MNICVLTKSKALHSSTLQNLCTLVVNCTAQHIPHKVHFITGFNEIHKYLKENDKVVVFDYGTQISNVPELLKPLPKGYVAKVFPGVKEGIDWNLFKTRTLEGSTIPAEQRGLSFDTELDKEIEKGVWSVKSTEARVWLFDPVVYRKKNKTNRLNLASFKDFFASLDEKICASTECRCTFHYVHECKSNILESTGVKYSC